MKRIDARGAAIQAVIAGIGEALSAHIAARYRSVKEFCAQAGIPRSTLYRFLSGGHVSGETLVRILRALHRWDVLDGLLAPPTATPMELLARQKTSRSTTSETINLPAAPKLKLAHREGSGNG